MLMPLSSHNFLNTSGGIPWLPLSISLNPIIFIVSNVLATSIGKLLRKVKACTPNGALYKGLLLWAETFFLNGRNCINRSITILLFIILVFKISFESRYLWLFEYMN